MRKYGLYLLIAAGLLAGCQKKDMIGDVPAAETGTSLSVEKETTGEAETKNAAETSDSAGELQEEDRSEPIPIAVSSEYDGEWDDSQTAIITSRCDKVYLQGSGYEALKNSLSSLNEEMVSANKKEYEEYKPEAMDMRKTYTDQKLTYVCNYEFRPIRFDGSAASMAWLKYYDFGGAHPSSYNAYYNFDAQTGKRLELTDVVKDMDGFTAYVKNELAEYADQGELFEGYEETVDTMFAGTDPAQTLEWAVTEKGVSVYFEEYMIAPYAAGEIEVAVPFSENKEMFEEAYAGSGSAGWTKRITPWETVTYADGQTDTSLSYTYEGAAGDAESEYAQTLTIERERDGKKDTFTDEVYGKIGDTWLIMTDDGRSYLYMELSSENDWTTLEVFDLNGETVKDAGSSNDSMKGSPIQTPDTFYLTRRIDALGTYDAYRKFHVGEDGMPEAEGDVYKRVLVWDSKDEETPLVSTRELPVTVIGDDGSKKEEKLPSGTKYYMRATDLESFVDLELSDGRTCRLSVQKSDEGSGFMIDGVQETDCFEMIPYAG